MKKIFIILVLGLATILVVYQFISAKKEAQPVSTAQPVAENAVVGQEKATHIMPARAAFVGRLVCAECHLQQEQLWSGSHHDWAMREATEDTVLGNFEDSVFEHEGESWRFYTRDGLFFVNTIGPQGKKLDYRVRYTFGVDPLQQYLLELPRGRLQALTVAWDTRSAEKGGQRWFHLLPEEKTTPGGPLHWTGRAYNWNSRCAECHSTNLEKKYDLSSDSYESSWSEVNVSCEACHGPGSRHVKWANIKAEDNSVIEEKKGLVVDYRKHAADFQVETCVRCHSRRHPVSENDGHGRPFLDDFMPATLDEGLYYPDGQIQDEVYVYGSFLQSRMYNEGVACTDCHDPHSTQLKFKGNALCLQCHQSSPPSQRFPTLKAGDYDSPEHHFHPAGSEGAQCVNCHMPARTYMVVDPRRDHSFKIPRPELSALLGTPNACSACHQDKSSRWAIEAIEKKHGPRPDLSDSSAVVFAAARKGDTGSVVGLRKLLDDEQGPAIVRATALTLLSPFFPDREAVAAVVAALKNSDPLIRASAAGQLDNIPLQYRQSLLSPLLDDPIRAVRIEAARLLAGIESSAFGQQQSTFETALEEYRALQRSLADTPEAHVNLAVMYTEQNWLDRAEAAYLRAIEIAPEFIPARINLANLYNKQKRNRDAEQQLRQAIQLAPEVGELYYSLGLLLAEEQRLEEVAELLGKATRLMPARTRVAYNYALTLQQLGRLDEAESTYLATLAISSQDADVIYALVTLYSQQEQWQKALPFATQLEELLNGEKGSGELLRDIRGKIDNIKTPE